MKETYFLAIETSCDDTAIAVMKAREEYGKPFGKTQCKLKKIEALSNIVSSQTRLHAEYGGIYPSLAKREHQKNLPAVFAQATKNFDLSKLEFIAVTYGPGLDPCLWTGINFAQDLAKKYNLPLVGINHLEAHFLANLLTLGIGEERFVEDYLPAVCLVVSGGHTILFLAKAIGDYQLLGQTVDDAAGECFDKAARILNLGYPGGSEIARCAQKGLKRVRPFLNKKGRTLFKPFEIPIIRLPRPMMNQKNYNFSFSGLKTAVLYEVQKRKPEVVQSDGYKIAMSYEIQQAIVDVLVKKTMRAAKEFGVKSIIIGGGVSANLVLRVAMKKAAEEINVNPPSRKATAGAVKFLAPSADLSMDNAAMAGVAGYFARKRGEIIANLEDLKSEPNLSI